MSVQNPRIEIRLSLQEIHLARAVAIRRSAARKFKLAAQMKRDRRNKAPLDSKSLVARVLAVVGEGSLKIGILRAEAELAVSKYFGIPWDGRLIGDGDWAEDADEDVGPIEVRTTLHKTGRLIVHPKDDDDAPFVLVRAHRSPIYEIIGWQTGRECKKEEYWEDVGCGRPGFYLPNDKLRSLTESLFEHF